MTTLHAYTSSLIQLCDALLVRFDISHPHVGPEDHQASIVHAGNPTETQNSGGRTGALLFSGYHVDGLY